MKNILESKKTNRINRMVWSKEMIKQFCDR